MRMVHLGKYRGSRGPYRELGPRRESLTLFRSVDTFTGSFSRAVSEVVRPAFSIPRRYRKQSATESRRHVRAFGAAPVAHIRKIPPHSWPTPREGNEQVETAAENRNRDPPSWHVSSPLRNPAS